MAGQELGGDVDASPTRPCADDVLLDVAIEVIAEFGYSGLTLARLADAAGSSRMTLHRREVTLASVVAGLGLRAAAELRAELFPVLTATGPADQRLRAALVAMCDVADHYLPLLAGLFSADDGVFHSPPDATGALPTTEAFVAPFVKLLADGEADGSLRPQADRTETATILFNAVGWGYVQLRHTQRWPPTRARDGVLRLVLTGLARSQEPDSPIG